MTKAVIEKIVIKHMVDNSPDLSYLGEYKRDWEPGCIDRKNRVRNWTNRQLRYFIPGNTYREHWDGLHKMGYSKADCDYMARQYNFEDFKRMEAIAEGDIWELGVAAEAEVSYTDRKFIPASRRIQRLSSYSLWGIASDDKDQIKQTEEDQLEDLKDVLRQFNVSIRNFNKLALEAEVKDD